MGCQVIRCMNNADAVFPVQEDGVPIDAPICRDHLRAINGGEEWVWVRQSGEASPFDRSRPAMAMLMGKELLAHNEWVVEDIGSFAQGDERSPDGAHWVWELRARRRGNDAPETLRLVVSPREVALMSRRLEGMD